MLDNIRVLILFGGTELYGQERAIVNVFQRLKPQGIKVTFVTHREWGFQQIEPELKRHGFEWAPAAFGPLLGKKLFHEHLIPALRGIWDTNAVIWKMYRRIRPTHIFLGNWQFFVYAFPVIALLPVPVIFRLGDLPDRHTFWHRRLWTAMSRRVAVFVCNSRYVAARLNAFMGRTEKIRVIPNVPVVRYAVGDAKNLRPSAGQKVILYVGQVTEIKGVRLLVQAFRRLCADHPDTVLWIAGEYIWNNPVAEDLKHEVLQDGMGDRIRFLGYVHDVPDLLMKSYLHVCPSMDPTDSSSNAIFEAKESGLPTVAFPIAGTPELIEHGRDGYLCERITANALETGIRFYLDHPDQRQSQGEAARKSLQNRFSEERFVRDWGLVFSETCRGKKKR